MLSRAPRQRLDSAQSRKISLATHINHKDWTPTPYISFTGSAEALKELANFRNCSGKRSNQTLIVIDPDIWLRNGRPILNVAAEMEHYGIPDPYGKSNKYYIDYYVCVWEVTTQEVVGQWDWDALSAHEEWYNEIVMSSYLQHRQKIAPNPFEDKLSGMSRLMDGLRRKLLGQPNVR